MLVLLLPVAATLVGGCAYFVVSMAPPRTRVGRWLALWIAAWAEIVLTAEVLSLLDAVTPLGFLLCYIVFAGIAVTVWVRRGRPRVRLLTMPRRGEIGQALRKHPALAALLVVLAVCALVNLALAVALPVSNWDSLSYHLSRVGYWIQNGSTDHFVTHSERQNYSPPNAEFGILSSIIFARAEWPAPLAQYAAYFACLAAVYFTARRLGASDAGALFGALLLGTMTETVLQATVPKNGLVVSSFLAASVGFALMGLRPGEAEAVQAGERRRALVWSAVALGLAVGTKATALFFLPGLVVAGVVFTLTGRGRGRFRLGALWAVSCACAVLLLGSFNYFRNLSHYGSIAGGERGTSGMRIAHPSWDAFASNLARYGYHFCDFSGLLPQQLARELTEARAGLAPPIFESLGITLNSIELNAWGRPALFPVDEATRRFDAVSHLHEDKAWFGPIAFFVGLPLVLVHLVRSPFRRKWAHFSLALMPVVYWLAICALLRYSPWRGRFFLTVAVCAAPFFSTTYMPTRVRALKHIITWLLVAVGVSTALTATFCNESKPLVTKVTFAAGFPSQPEASVFDVPRSLLRTRLYPEGYTLLNIPEKRLPRRMRLGLVIGVDDWDWPLFGPRLERTLVLLPRDPARIAEVFRSGEVDMVVIRKSIGLDEMPPIVGERPFLVPPNEERDSRALAELRSRTWSFIVRRDEGRNVFYPARDWQTVGSYWFGADQRFVPTRLLARGTVSLELEAGPCAAEGELAFDVFAGEARIDTFKVAEPGRQRRRIPWAGNGELADQILRIKVTSPDAALETRLRDSRQVYQLLRLPQYEPAEAGTP